ncbi:MAG: GLPGLI family protein [Ferruginibacter sp.]
MKKVIIAGCFLFTAGIVQAQQKEGKVVYERVSQMIARFNVNGVDQEMPRTRKDNFELTFSAGKSLWKAIEKDEDNDGGGGDGVQIRMIVAGSNDVLFTNFETGKRVERREFMDKTFIVDDSIGKLKWKMTGETKTILNHTCMKATSERISTQMRMNVDNGVVERKEITDTAVVIAWFTNDIPVPAGPAEFQGQLPGLILEMDINNGRQKFTATSIPEKFDLAEIKEPTGKKHYTAAEFKTERDKLMAEMQRNNQDGRGNIQIRN